MVSIIPSRINIEPVVVYSNHKVATNEMLASDLLGGNELNKFSELTWSSAVNTKHTLLVSGEAVKMQRNFVLGVSTDHQHATLQTPIISHTAVAQLTPSKIQTAAF